MTLKQFFRDALRGEGPGQGGKKKPGPAKPATTENPFVKLAAPEAEVKPAKPTSARFASWSHEPEPASQRIWSKVLRGTVLVVLVLFVWLGIRAMLFPVPPAPAPELPVSVQFPSSLAEGTAERFAVSYLTWDESNPKIRNQQMALDLVGGGESNALGWDGKGKQSASDAHIAQVDPQSATEAQITVYLRVTPYQKDGTTWKPQASTWQALEVPVAISEGRAVVTGQPGFVGMTSPKPVQPNPAPLDDPAVTSQTRSYMTAFLDAYGKESDVSALTAPGSNVSGLGGELTIDSLRSWTVYMGSGDSRKAVATVLWKTKSGGNVEMTYTLDLVKVAGGGSDRWQVSTITGGNKTIPTN
ncbi:hypothetical protein M707_21895 [Arthrobacter sp. AK-YN10]|nr:hypothetical protein M707_21895 [Arthrobacter sp. AK-YN10]